MDQRLITKNDEDRIETDMSISMDQRKMRVVDNAEPKSPQAQLQVTRNETQLLMNHSSKTSQPDEINSRDITINSNKEIENNFSTTTSKDKLILKS